MDSGRKLAVQAPDEDENEDEKIRGIIRVNLEYRIGRIGT